MDRLQNCNVNEFSPFILEYSYIDIILYHTFGCNYIQTQEIEANEAIITRLRNENNDNMRQLRDEKVFLIQ